MTGFIYKITNDINDKVYIGKTIKSIEDRFKEHLSDSKKATLEKRPLYCAIRKYGEEHFSVSLIEECDLDILSNREIFWINYYSAFAKGYNATIGGDGKPLYDYEKIAEVLKTGVSNKDICNKFGCCDETVTVIRKTVGIPATTKNSNSIQIKQFDLNENFIQEFESAGAAARWISDNCGVRFDSGIKSHILDVCRGKRKTAYKYKWRFS